MSRSGHQGSSNNIGSWIFPILMLFIFPPIGILLLVVKLFNLPKNTQSNQSRSRHPYYMQKEQQEREPLGARTTVGAVQAQASGGRNTAAFARNDQLDKMDSMGKRLVVVGSILSVLFLLVSVQGLSEALYWAIGGDMDWFLQDLAELLPYLCFLGGSLGCLWVGLSKRKQARRFHRYFSMIGKRKSIELSELSSAAGRPIERVQKDLEDMFACDLFPLGYLDYSHNRLVLSNEGIHKEAPKPAPKPAPEPKVEKKEESPENAILAEIRDVNDAIEDEKLSEQIDRIGIITAKILEYQHSHPEKSPQLHSFLSYYLPTTLKILRAYAQLEAQGIAGENITAAMERIESMMDKVVEGFEKQLDMLFQGDAMDITTDVDVLERMLAKDGLNEDDLTLKL